MASFQEMIRYFAQQGFETTLHPIGGLIADYCPNSFQVFLMEKLMDLDRMSWEWKCGFIQRAGALSNKYSGSQLDWFDRDRLPQEARQLLNDFFESVPSYMDELYEGFYREFYGTFSQTVHPFTQRSYSADAMGWIDRIQSGGSPRFEHFPETQSGPFGINDPWWVFHRIMNEAVARYVVGMLKRECEIDTTTAKMICTFYQEWGRKCSTV